MVGRVRAAFRTGLALSAVDASLPLDRFSGWPGSVDPPLTGRAISRPPRHGAPQPLCQRDAMPNWTSREVPSGATLSTNESSLVRSNAGGVCRITR